MKRRTHPTPGAAYRALPLIALLLAACSKAPAPDDPGAAGASDSPEPAVLIVIIDGLKPDAVARADTPNLDELAEAGAYTARAQSVMPTITRTNFVTFATGALTDEHGIVGGRYLDASWKERATDGPTMQEAQAALPVPTIFEVAEAEGLRAGMLGMKGYELVAARGARIELGGAELFPEDLWAGRYDPQDGGSADESVRRSLLKNEIVVDRLEDVVAEQPLDLVLVNIGATDYVAHTQGPDTAYYIEAIEASDAMIPRLQAIVREAAPDRAWHILVGADHGFSQVDRDQLVVPHLEGVFEVQKLAEAGIEHRIYERGGRAAELYLRDGAQLARAAEMLQELPWVRRIYADGDLPGAAGSYDDLRVGFPGRRGSIYVITEPPYAFAYDNQGQHGSDDPEDQTVPLWLAGPSIAAGAVDLAGASNADVGPTALDLLGIDPDAALEGSGESLLVQREPGVSAAN